MDHTMSPPRVGATPWLCAHGAAWFLQLHSDTTLVCAALTRMRAAGVSARHLPRYPRRGRRLARLGEVLQVHGERGQLGAARGVLPGPATAALGR